MKKAGIGLGEGQRCPVWTSVGKQANPVRSEEIQNDKVLGEKPVQDGRQPSGVGEAFWGKNGPGRARQGSPALALRCPRKPRLPGTWVGGPPAVVRAQMARFPAWPGVRPFVLPQTTQQTL